jgi:hypothetical protein
MQLNAPLLQWHKNALLLLCMNRRLRYGFYIRNVYDVWLNITTRQLDLPFVRFFRRRLRVGFNDTFLTTTGLLIRMLLMAESARRPINGRSRLDTDTREPIKQPAVKGFDLYEVKL